MIPADIFEIIASLVETPQCLQSLALCCLNASVGCRKYMTRILKRSYVNVQILYWYGMPTTPDEKTYLFQIPYDAFMKRVEETHNEDDYVCGECGIYTPSITHCTYRPKILF